MPPFIDAPLEGPSEAEMQEAKIVSLEKDKFALKSELETKKSDLAAATIDIEQLAEVIHTQVEEKNSVVDTLIKEKKSLLAEFVREKRLRIQIQLAGSHLLREQEFESGNFARAEEFITQATVTAKKKSRQRGPRRSELKKAANANSGQVLAGQDRIAQDLDGQQLAGQDRVLQCRAGKDLVGQKKQDFSDKRPVSNAAKTENYNTEPVATEQPLTPIQYLFRGIAAVSEVLRFIV